MLSGAAAPPGASHAPRSSSDPTSTEGTALTRPLPEAPTPRAPGLQGTLCPQSFSSGLGFAPQTSLLRKGPQGWALYPQHGGGCRGIILG